jgi:hypothetical protein
MKVKTQTLMNTIIVEKKLTWKKNSVNPVQERCKIGNIGASDDFRLNGMKITNQIILGYKY